MEGPSKSRQTFVLRSIGALSIQPNIPEISVGTSGPALKVVHFDRSGQFSRSDRNAHFHLTKSLSLVPLFRILTRTITKCAVAWVGSVQRICTVPLGTSGNFRNFKPEFLLNGKRPRSKLRVPDKDDVKQKTSLFSVQGKICLVFCSFVLRDLCPVNEVNAEVYDQWN